MIGIVKRTREREIESTQEKYHFNSYGLAQRVVVLESLILKVLSVLLPAPVNYGSAVRICPKRDGVCPKINPADCDDDCGLCP